MARHGHGTAWARMGTIKKNGTKGTARARHGTEVGQARARHGHESWTGTAQHGHESEMGTTQHESGMGTARHDLEKK